MEDIISAITQNFNRQQGNTGEEDYADLLANYMNAKNRGMQDDQFLQVLFGLDRGRLSNMQRPLGSTQSIVGAREPADQLNRLLESILGSR